MLSGLAKDSDELRDFLLVIEEVPESELPAVRNEQLVVVVIQLESLASVGLELEEALLADQVILVDFSANRHEHEGHVDF